MSTKTEFINAHMYLYGTSKCKSEKIYKELKKANRNFCIDTIIELYYEERRKTFYND